MNSGNFIQMATLFTHDSGSVESRHIPSLAQYQQSWAMIILHTLPPSPHRTWGRRQAARAPPQRGRRRPPWRSPSSNQDLRVLWKSGKIDHLPLLAAWRWNIGQKRFQVDLNSEGVWVRINKANFRWHFLFRKIYIEGWNRFLLEYYNNDRGYNFLMSRPKGLTLLQDIWRTSIYTDWFSQREHIWFGDRRPTQDLPQVWNPR